MEATGTATGRNCTQPQPMVRLRSVGSGWVPVFFPVAQPDLEALVVAVHLCSPCSNILSSYALREILRIYLTAITVYYLISQQILVQLRRRFIWIASQLYMLSVPTILVSKATNRHSTLIPRSQCILNAA